VSVVHTTKHNFSYNLEKLLAQKGWDIRILGEEIGMKVNELEQFVCQPVSISNPLLTKISAALNCSIDALFEPIAVIAENDNEHNSRALLKSFQNIDLDLFLASVAKVDEIINKAGRRITSKDKAKAYLAFYELASRLLSSQSYFMADK
jgi:transcriptional regulator with XRE-family HTH domain